MSSYPGTQLLHLLLEISYLIEHPDRGNNFSIVRCCLEFLYSLRNNFKHRIPFSSLDLKNLVQYMRILGVDPDFSVRMSEKMYHNELWRHRFESNSYQQVAVMVVSFVQNDLKEVFDVSKFLQLEDGIHTRTYVVECFFEAFGTYIQDYPHLSSFGVSSVLKVLGSFCTIFSDRVFEAAEGEQVVHCLWAQFEGLINEVGRFVHSFIFSPDQVIINRVDTCLHERIIVMKDSIIGFLETWQSSPNSKVVYGDVDSFFIIDSLLNDLADFLNQNNPKIVDIKDHIGRLHNSLMLSWSLLKEHVEIKAFKEIAVQIKDMAYGAEYAINSFLVGAFPLWYVTSRLTGIIRCIKQLTGDRIQEVKDTYGVRALQLPQSLGRRESIRGSRGNVGDDIMVGFEKEKESILGQLLGETENLEIVSIIGTPGLGKTTLAKKLHNHPSVGDRFDRRSWCVVSQEYERKQLLVDILKGLGVEVENDKDEAKIALQIHQTLMGRRYLITLDDIWSSKAWDDLRHCFPNDGNGSRIIFTSRNIDVVPTGSMVNSLPFLSDDQCWELLEKKVFNGATCPPQLEVIGKRIAANCKGLPLVVVVLAGILSSMPTKANTWREVGGNLDAYIFSDQNKSVMHILELSYQHLSQQLRPCLLYFAVFPEDERITVKKLKHLWIAEGFIQGKGDKSKECVAEEYFEELVRKSLVIVTEKRSNGGAKSCVVHDLLHEMCLRIAEKEKVLKKISSEHWEDDRKFARLAFQSSSTYKHPYGPRTRTIRSLFCPDNASTSVTDMILLRVLKGSYRTDIIGIESTMNLRYTEMQELPVAKILSLENLEYLLAGPFFIPSQLFSKIQKLRYIKSSYVTLEPYFDISQLANNLEFLSNFWISSSKDEKMLKYSPHLRRLKCGYSVRKVDPHCLDLSFLTQLDSLSVVRQAKEEFRFSKASIKFPAYIRKLTLGRLWFSWEEISVIAVLPSLEVLKLERESFVGEKWDTREDEFKKLRFLKMEDLSLRQWNVSSSEHFPVLEQLLIHRCWIREGIPPEIGDISTLQLIDVLTSKSERSILESARRIQQEQLDMGNEELAVVTSFYDLSKMVFEED